MIQLLTAPEVLTSPALAQRYMVQLASIATELDSQGVPVPVATEIVDVLVVDASDITTLLDATGHLNGYEVVSHWIPEDACPF